MKAVALGLLALLALLCGCVPQFDSVGCYSTAECPAQFECVERGCVLIEADAALDQAVSDATADASQPAEGLAGGQGYGTAIAVIGDIDADGFADVAIGAPEDRPAGCAGACGRVLIYRGGADGLEATPTSIIDGVDGLESELGRRLLGPGDVNGDGFDDLVISTREGPVYVLLGSPDGLPSGRVDRIAHAALSPSTLFANSGVLLRSGDVNADGRPDIVVAARTYQRVLAQCERGPVEIHQPAIEMTIMFGDSKGVDPDAAAYGIWAPDDAVLCTCPDRGNRPVTCEVGSALAVLDLDGQPGDELIVGAARAAADAGLLQGFGPTVDVLGEATPGRCPGVRLGSAVLVSNAGDLDRDGRADLLAVVRGRSEDCRQTAPWRAVWLTGDPVQPIVQGSLFEAPVDAQGVGTIDQWVLDRGGDTRAHRVVFGRAQFDAGDGQVRSRLWSRRLDGPRSVGGERLLLESQLGTQLSGGLAVYRATPDGPASVLVGVRPISGAAGWHVESIQLPP